ncbi:putative Gamma-tubulin complex subunit [Leptomonas pyrrhocoris]|uniref:Putative Gamma-tubulin complex subunit n=1 Tax=Leptomonas pyrrhocoris TaxID=157538 RepID=A0A0M9G8P9_LEPPY|nr:putative Gamma-tubulin complex subunit [Leptomonas pyrrhocoris]KPA85110.1 putative Gamma-tubulin complex subunit [Leptomonas pyrrhocoris]|eukprot:XP_015663549.1 putative Gamma-tubulin complex subunit [Leptomonas pyrrhocoris]
MSVPPPSREGSMPHAASRSREHSPLTEEERARASYASASTSEVSSTVRASSSRANEFALPRRDTAGFSSGTGGVRTIPFYAAAPSALKDASATAPHRQSPRTTLDRSGAGGDRSDPSPPRLSSTGVATNSSTPALARSFTTERHDLPGKLFGTHGTQRQRVSGSGDASAEAPRSDISRRGSLPSLGAGRRDPSGSIEQPSGGGVASSSSPFVERRSTPTRPSPSAANVGASGRPIEEALFYADVLFMWMGVTQTQYFTYDASENAYCMTPGVGTAVQQQAAEVFQECGTLARHIDVALRQPSSTGDSFLQQSLRSALRRQLTQYHYLVSMIRERRDPPLHMGDLMVAYKRVQPKLWVMECVLRETQHVKGGELASKMQQLVQQGSHRLSSLLYDIYIETVSPLLLMTVESITKGEVCDPLREFYIVPNDAVEDTAEDFWVSKYSLNTEMLPSTVPESVAHDILLVTKNIRFICRCCRAKQWRMDPVLLAEAERATFDTLPIVVHRALAFTNTAVLRLIREEFELVKVLRLVNAFLLVGYGDFYELLITKLEPILSKMSSAVHVSVVRDQVQSALAEITPYAKHLDTDRLALLQCEMVKDDGKLGWDSFVMTMPLPSPLNNLFDQTAMKVYRRLFRLMFRVKVAEVALKKAWRQNVMLDRLISSVQRSSQEVSAWREVAADAHLLGLQLNHFVNNLWSYLVAEVCTVAQDLLLKAIERCASMDDIRTAHNAYLAYLTQRSLLHSDCATIRMNVENIVTIVREYCGSQALLTSLLQRGSGDLSTVKRQYQGLTDDFHREMSSLLTTLEEQHVHFDFLNFLLLRLNFNRFYHDTSDAAYNTEF